MSLSTASSVHSKMYFSCSIISRISLLKGANGPTAFIETYRTLLVEHCAAASPDSPSKTLKHGPSKAFFCRAPTARNRNKRPSMKTVRRDGNAPTAEAGINLSGDFVWEDVCQEVTWHKSGSGGGRSGITRPFCAPPWQRRLYERLTLRTA